MILSILLSALVLALITSYSFLMTILKKAPETKLLTKEAATTFVASLAALVLLYVYERNNLGALAAASMLFLLLAVLASLFQVIILRRTVPVIQTLQTAGILVFSSVLFSVFVLLALLSLS